MNATDLAKEYEIARNELEQAISEYVGETAPNCDEYPAYVVLSKVRELTPEVSARHTAFSAERGCRSALQCDLCMLVMTDTFLAICPARDHRPDSVAPDSCEMNCCHSPCRPADLLETFTDGEDCDRARRSQMG
jgi:hypothetical protein